MLSRRPFHQITPQRTHQQIIEAIRQRRPGLLVFFDQAEQPELRRLRLQPLHKIGKAVDARKGINFRLERDQDDRQLATDQILPNPCQPLLGSLEDVDTIETVT